jgi:hypothetical protein
MSEKHQKLANAIIRAERAKKAYEKAYAEYLELTQEKETK